MIKVTQKKHEKLLRNKIYIHIVFCKSLIDILVSTFWSLIAPFFCYFAHCKKISVNLQKKEPKPFTVFSCNLQYG